MAKNEQGLAAIKTAFDCGYNSFCRVEPNARGFMQNPPNTYKDNTLLNKEWQRGFNRAYWESQKKDQTCA